jgi:hypothetical protein
MTQRRDWSEDEILGIFDVLGLRNRGHKAEDAPKSEPKKQAADKPIYLPRLSSSSVPPPTGRNKNAKLQNPSKRG